MYANYNHTSPIAQVETYSPNSTLTESAITLSEQLSYRIEIEKMRNILKENGFEVQDYWIPNKDLSKESTIFFKCKIPDEIANNNEKLEEFEYSLYKTLKPVLKESKFFKMVALL